MASSAQLRRTFEEMPPDYCMDFVRGRAGNLLREGRRQQRDVRRRIEDSDGS